MLKIVARKLTDVVKAKDKILQISPEKHSSIDKAGFYANKPASIDAGDNPVAYKIINSESISLHDQELKFNQIDITTMKNLELNNEFIQSDLGDISLYGKHEILLEDVDPKRITNKTIILWGQKAKLTAIGRKVDGQGSEGVGRIDKQIFFEEKKKHGVSLTWKHYLWAVMLSPAVFYFLVYLQVVREYTDVNSFYVSLDRENKELLDQIKSIPSSIYKSQKYLEKLYPD